MSFPDITLISKEGEAFQVSRAVAKLSHYVTNFHDDEALDNFDEELGDMPVPEVSSQVMQQVIVFCNHYLEDPLPALKKPVSSPNIADQGATDWYVQFVTPLGETDLYHLIMAANFMDIKPLFDLMCATIACSIYHKSPQEVRQMFNIPDDISFDELDTQRKLRTWREEHPGFPESDPLTIQFELDKKLKLSDSTDQQLTA